MSCHLGIYLITLLHAVAFVQRSFYHSNTKRKENKQNEQNEILDVYLLLTVHNICPPFCVQNCC